MSTTSTDTRPFQPYLNSRLDAKTARTLQLVAEANTEARELESLEQLIDTGNDQVLWALAYHLCHKQTRSPGGADAPLPHPTDLERGTYPVTPSAFRRMVSRLLQRAVADARDAGVSWTLVLDTIALSGLWPGETSPDLPAPEDLLSGLVPWVQQTEDPAAIEELLTFRFSGVREVVAAHTVALPVERQLEITDTPEIAAHLRSNPSPNTISDEALVRHLSACWIEYATRHMTIEAFEREALFGSILYRVVADGAPLPDDIREAIVQLTDPESAPSLPSIKNARQILLQDPQCPEAVIRLAGSDAEMWELFPLVLMHPGCPPDLYEEIIAIPSNACLLLRESDRPSGEMIRDIYARHETNGQVVRYIAGHMNTPVEILLELASPTAEGDWSEDFYEVLAANPTAVADPDIRNLLKRSDHPSTIARLVDAAPPGEYEELMVRLLGRMRSLAIQRLREHGIPGGVPHPTELLSLLLESPDREERLLAITLLGGSTRNEQQETPRSPTVRERGHSR